MSSGQRVDRQITLCLTVLNEARGIGRFLATLGRQRVLPGEVIIVDGGSSDGTREVLGEHVLPEGVAIRVLTMVGANIAEGRNEAIRNASSEWIAITDGGTELDEGWLEALSARMSPDFDVVSGFFAPLPGDGWQTTIGALITPLASEVDPESFLPSSRSIAFRREIWSKVGGYPEWLDYCEDLIFDLNMKDVGGRFSFAEDAVARWDARPTLSSYAKQYYRYARGDGKAGLWPRRHAIRYVTYGAFVGTSVAFARSRSPLFVAAVAPAGGIYLRRFVMRAMRHPDLTPRERVRAAVAAPLVVAVGDLAKMAGYPAGLAWRKGKEI